MPVSDTAKFTSYTADGFDEVDHRRLAKLFRQLAGRGVHVALSNSDTELVAELYAGVPMTLITRAGSVNSKASARGTVFEVLITSERWSA